MSKFLYASEMFVNLPEEEEEAKRNHQRSYATLLSSIVCNRSPLALWRRTFDPLLYCCPRSAAPPPNRHWNSEQLCRGQPVNANEGFWNSRLLWWGQITEKLATLLPVWLNYRIFFQRRSVETGESVWESSVSEVSRALCLVYILIHACVLLVFTHPCACVPW